MAYKYCWWDRWKAKKRNPRKRAQRDAFLAMIWASEKWWDCSENYDPEFCRPLTNQPWYHHEDRYHRHECFMAWMKGEPMPAEEGYDGTRDHCHYLWRTGQL